MCWVGKMGRPIEGTFFGNLCSAASTPCETSLHARGDMSPEGGYLVFALLHPCPVQRMQPPQNSRRITIILAERMGRINQKLFGIEEIPSFSDQGARSATW